MKFDVCLMNPPYDGNLHLKFLAKAIQISNYTVNISPVRWLQDPTASDKKNSDYNKFENSISKHIKSLDIIQKGDVNLMFNILSVVDLGIYVCDEAGGFDYKQLSTNNILAVVKRYINENLVNIDADKKDGWRVRIPLLLNNGGSGKRKPSLHNLGKLLYFYNGCKDGILWYNWYKKNQYSKLTDTITRSIKFNTEAEAQNFIKSFDTNFVKYIESQLITNVQISSNKILYMGNAVNPRTNKVGYLSEWRDEDFIEFFNLKQNDIDMINQYLRDFNQYVKEWKKNNSK